MSDLPDNLTNITATSADYTQLVAVTEACDFELIASRIKPQYAVRAVMGLLLNLSILGEEADVIKKALFYDKPKKTINEEAVETDVLDLNEEQGARLVEINTIRLLHAMLGMVTESAGELAPLILDYVDQGTPIDWVNVAEELGDCLWYVGLGTNLQNQHTGQTFNDILTRNIRKLALRYGNKFSEKSAKNRDLEGERKVLEGETYIIRDFLTQHECGRTTNLQEAMGILRKETASNPHSVGLEIA